MSKYIISKVSIIIATYNRAALLPRAIKSVLAQTFTDYELIIVDDCSSDDTWEIVGDFTDPRIRVFRHETNRGAAATRNTGIARARGEYITFLDDDDECTPNRLADQVSVLDTNPDVGMVYGWIEEINDATGSRRVPKNVQNTHRGKAAFEAALTGISDTAAMFNPCISGFCRPTSWWLRRKAGDHRRGRSVYGVRHPDLRGRIHTQDNRPQTREPPIRPTKPDRLARRV